MELAEPLTRTEEILTSLKKYVSMKPVTRRDYLEFSRQNSDVVIGGKKIKLGIPTPRVLQPEDFEVEATTVWSFPKRGRWATHKYNASYRGNWAPQIARNLLLLYSHEGDRVLDPFMGSGTTIIECVLLRRRCLGVDVNEHAVMLAWSRIAPVIARSGTGFEPQLYTGDARNLNLIEDETVDLIATHPPYSGIISYTGKTVEGDLSAIRSLEEYLFEMRIAGKELWRVLRPGGHLAIMIGDIRRRKHIVPLGFRVLELLLDLGFILREHIVKVQHNMEGTRKWLGRNKGFLLIKHEHIFVLRKPRDNREYRVYKYSSKPRVLG